jgi:hypothetical protein
VACLPAGSCELPDGVIARCDTTGEISFIQGGTRHQFSGDVYAAYGMPRVQFNETDTCPRMVSCPLGSLVPGPVAAGKCVSLAPGLGWVG